jgi:hypothetical protein
MLQIIDNENGIVLEEKPVRISFDYLRRFAAEMEKINTNNELFATFFCFGLKIFGLETEEAADILNAFLCIYEYEEQNIYRAVLQAVQDSEYIEVIP